MPDMDEKVSQIIGPANHDIYVAMYRLSKSLTRKVKDKERHEYVFVICGIIKGGYVRRHR